MTINLSRKFPLELDVVTTPVVPIADVAEITGVTGVETG